MESSNQCVLCQPRAISHPTLDIHSQESLFLGAKKDTVTYQGI